MGTICPFGVVSPVLQYFFASKLAIWGGGYYSRALHALTFGRKQTDEAPLLVHIDRSCIATKQQPLAEDEDLLLPLHGH